MSDVFSTQKIGSIINTILYIAIIEWYTENKNNNLAV